MSESKEATTRELLRNFKIYKDQLLDGKISTVVISVGKGESLELSVKKKKGNGKKIAETFGSLKKPIKIERTNIFNEFLRLND